MQKHMKVMKSGYVPKPSIRLYSLWYLLANLRFQDQVTTSDILSQAKLVRALFQHIKDDPPTVIRETLDTLRKHVIMDTALSRTAKSRLLTDWTLSRVADLHNYKEDEQDIPEEQASVKDSAFAFLHYVCTTPDQGVLLSQRGWYPSGTEMTIGGIDAAYSSPAHGQRNLGGKYTDSVSIRNTTLSRFLQTLRPYASALHRDLTLAAFKAAPELVADYFLKKEIFSFEPKLSTTWIGYSAFLFSVIQLPVPYDDTIGALPPVSIVIESILPRPLTQKSMTRCLNQSSALISFFAIKLLTVAFRKLELILRYFRSKVRPAADVDATQSRLRAEFCRRCPEPKHVITAFRSCSPKSTVLKESLLRLLVMYYKFVPLIALDAKFDVSIALSNTLSDINSQKAHLADRGIRLLELDHLLEIAHLSPNMQWWQKPGQ